MHDDIKSFFLNPRTPKQRQYEALRAFVIDGIPAQKAARKFGFSKSYLYFLMNSFRSGKLNLFASSKKGPKDRRTTPYVRDMIIELRKRNLSIKDIVEKLKKEKVTVHERTVERVLKDAGFERLKRRTNHERGRTKKNVVIPRKAKNLNPTRIPPFKSECQVAGIFFFLPYIIESGIMDVIERLPLPHSGCIGKKQAFLSFLALKFMGGERLSHVGRYDHDPGFGLFAGLNVLPKPTYMGSYSCMFNADLCRSLQKECITCFQKWTPSLFKGSTINLDFHSIPHFGEQTGMEKVWCGSRNKAMKGANTFFAQDAETNIILYANADVIRKEGADEVLHFVDYMRDIKGIVKETLVFDSRLTTYTVLNRLDKNGIKFITLRSRCKSLDEQTVAIPESDWEKVKLPIPKRKRRKFLAHESRVILKNCDNPFRQIIMKDHGRAQPTYVITNNWDMKLIEVLLVYAHRWRIENKLDDLVSFFNINALSSPIMIRIFWDLFMSVVASFFYSRFTSDLPRFEHCLAPTIFRRFVDVPGTVVFDGKTFEIHIRKRSHTPILLGVEKLQKPLSIPWLDDAPLKIHFKP